MRISVGRNRDIQKLILKRPNVGDLEETGSKIVRPGPQKRKTDRDIGLFCFGAFALLLALLNNCFSPAVRIHSLRLEIINSFTNNRHIARDLHHIDFQAGRTFSIVFSLYLFWGTCGLLTVVVNGLVFFSFLY